MPSAAPCLIKYLTLVLLTATLTATASPLTLVSDDFRSETDSLWHFQTATYRDGILSPGREAEIPGTGPTTGQLKIDPSAKSLIFTPRRLHNAFHACFLAYRNDFRIESVFASKVTVDLPGNLVDPSQNDSLGGLYLLIKYDGEYGYRGLARTVSKVKAGQSINLDTCAFIPIDVGHWLSLKKMDENLRATALGHITGIGLFYISADSGPAANQTFQLGGFRARGSLKWPRLEGDPSEGRVQVGDTLSLRWDFPSGLKAKFRWFRNERPVADAQGPDYRFSPSPDNVMIHVFRAEAKLENGDVVPTGEIRVQVGKRTGPVIRYQSGDTSVPVGGDVILKIKAEGSPPLSYQWFRNDKPIEGANQTFYTYEPTSIYESGKFHCEVTDRSGANARSRGLTLIVKPGAKAEGWVPQALTIAGKAGGNISDFYLDGGDEKQLAQYQLSYLQAGLQATWQLNPRFTLQTDLLFARKEIGREYSDHSTVLSLNYLECPLLVRIRLGSGKPVMPLYALAGGFGAFLISADIAEDWGAFKGSESAGGFTQWDFGPALGMVWQVGVMSLEWRYSYGMADLRAGTGEAPTKMGTLSGMVGFSLFSGQETAR